jgi:hypothetical protein
MLSGSNADLQNIEYLYGEYTYKTVTALRDVNATSVFMTLEPNSRRRGGGGSDSQLTSFYPAHNAAYHLLWLHICFQL